MSEATQVVEQPTEKAPEVQAPAAAGEATDPLSFFNAEHLPQEHRENYAKGFEGVKGQLSKLTEENGTYKQKAELADLLSGLPGFSEFMDDETIPDFKTMHDAYKAWKANGSGQAAPIPNGTATNGVKSAPSGVDPAEWNRMQQAVTAFENAQNDAKSHQAVASLLNKYPEASGLIKVPEIRDKILELTADRPDGTKGLDLEPAYALATREAYADLKIKGAAAKPVTEPETGTQGKTKTQKRFKSTEDAVSAAFDQHGFGGGDEE